jgi:nitrite reductase/ring-hydroxylating ferredoxin subunit
MLNAEDNEIMCRVGPGTPMGNLLRRYWMPALLSSEVSAPDSPPVRVRILAEDLIAFRDTQGHVGLVANACPHRGASLFFGRNEESGLRCVYHGWKFDTEGVCVDMPSEPAESNFKTRVRVLAYPTVESGGTVWAYLGPGDKMTPFRDFIGDNLPAERWRVNRVLSDCNWVQGLEGNLDTAHISFLHRNLSEFKVQPDETDKPGYPSNTMTTVIRARDQAPRIEIQDSWYGFRYAGMRQTPNGLTHARVTAFILPFMCYIATIPVGGDNCLMMVPIDDDHYYRWSFATKLATIAPGRDAPAANAMGPSARPPASMAADPTRPSPSRSNDYYLDREAQRTLSYTGIQGIGQQDMAVTESMGAIYDRSREHLGTTDAAVIRMRRMLIKAAKDLAAGIEPPALEGDFASIRSAEKILEPGEDWRALGTGADPVLAAATTS